jgi:hypothetical protein
MTRGLAALGGALIQSARHWSAGRGLAERSLGLPPPEVDEPAWLLKYPASPVE